MLRMFFPVLLGVLALPAPSNAQRGAGPACCGCGMSALAGAPLVELKGKVTQVRISPGQPMPQVVVKTASGESPVVLGSMRYLMVRNFSPKVGDEIVVKAYKTPTGFFAATVTLPESNKTIRLRDEAGRPLWRGAARGIQ